MATRDNLRTMVIVNPSSAAGANGRLWDRTARSLRRSLGHFEHAFTNAPLHATRLARQALRDNFEMVVAIGGDGTLNEVVCGFFDGDQPVAPRAMLGIVALGTGSDFARTLGAVHLEASSAHLAGRDSRLIDVGHASFIDHSGTPTERVFLNVASFGCSGKVAHRMSPRLKRLSGSLAYNVATLRTLLSYQDQLVSISLDGGPAVPCPITACAFCNGRYFGAGMQVAPHALIDDGKLDVTMWSGFGLLDFVRKRHSLYSGAHVHETGTRVFLARHAAATSAAEVFFELDGESVGRLPIRLKILRCALRLKI
jgi:YegS/Rv2252/BmrU family lipid kinase